MQLVGYEPRGRGSAVVFGDGERVDRRPLEPGETLSYSLGTRHCAGTIDDDEHVACDRAGTPYCQYHTSTWVCARCTGTCLKDEMDCYEEHAVYIAAFAPDTFKVGVTKSRRLETRLREQGADRGAHVHTVSNGRIARELEAEIAEWLVDRVRTPAKVASLAVSVDDDAWEDVLAEFDVLERFEFDYGLGLETQPVRETLLSGTIRGVKGRLLVLEQNGTEYAVDLRDLVGYEVDAGTTRQNLQSSLGSFG